jgi:hypothetical protein
MVRTGKIPSIFFCNCYELCALASSTSPHSGEAPVVFYPRVHRELKRLLIYQLFEVEEKDGVIPTLGDGWSNPSLGTRGGFCRMV